MVGQRGEGASKEHYEPAVHPYQFEPSVEDVRTQGNRGSQTTAEQSASGGESVESETFCRMLGIDLSVDRTFNTNWCKCGYNCANFSPIRVNYCCQEASAKLTRSSKTLAAKMEDSGLQCITEHASFAALCLNRDVLQALHHARESARSRILREQFTDDDRQYRWLAYSAFTYWVNKTLGIGKRLEIPACAQKKIIDMFPGDLCATKKGFMPIAGEADMIYCDD